MSIFEKAMRQLNDARTGARARLTPQPRIGPPTAGEAGGHSPALATARKASIQPMVNRRTARLVPGAAPLPKDESQHAAEFRRIKRPLLAVAFGKGAIQVEHGNLIAVTSSLPGEGKTSTSVHLSRSMALERNHTVLLIDTDVAKRNASRMYGLENAAGLIDVLLDERLNLYQVAVQTDLPSLLLVPAGKQHPHATELLASQRMQDLVTALAERNAEQIHVFDTAPLMASSEPQVVTTLVGQIVLVVEADRTPQHVVKEAVATLDSSKAINLVLNKGQFAFGGDYGYGYGYVYGYGQKDE
jgi:exopolysaccharide/PEP-CTERM locus tyrosine autokinase